MCHAAEIDGSEEPRIIATIDSAKYLHLTGSRPTRGRREASSLYKKYIDGIERSYGLRYVEDWPLSSLGETMLVFAAGVQQPITLLLDDIERQRVFNSVQVVRRMRIAAKRASQFADAEPLASFQENLDVLGIVASHNWATGRGVRIAVIDTGVDRSHPDLRRRVEQSVDFTGGQSRDFDADIHGTVVASIIAGARDDKGMLGIAPEAQLIALKACTERPTKNHQIGCDSVALARALDHAIEEAPDIINLSVTGNNDPLLSRLIATAVKRNIPVVGVKSELSDHTFPSEIDGVVAVAGDAHWNSQINPDRPLLAPSRLVLGALPGGDYDYFNGHSVAVAEVSGIVALLLQRKPHLAPDVIVRLLQSTSHSDSGLVHACESLARIVGVPCKN